jgi:putative spermidine/putrescine transport system substrate-binding protein
VKARELVVMSWAGGWGRALWSAVSEPFAKATGVSVRHAIHVGLKLPEALTAALSAGERAPYDVVWCNGVPAVLAARAGWCDAFTPDEVPPLRELVSRARPEQDPAASRGAWSTVFPYVVQYVLTYRVAAYPEGPPASWSALLDPRHRERIALYPGGNGFYPVAQIMGGGSLADIPHDMRACWRYVERLRPQVGTLDYSIGMGDLLRDGRLDLCFRALTNALAFREDGIDVDWTAPREGVPDTVDALWIPRGLPDDTASLAREYIAFALSREVQEAWAHALGVLPVHRDARAPQDRIGRAHMPRSAAETAGVLHVPDGLKVSHEAAWEARFQAIVRG